MSVCADLLYLFLLVGACVAVADASMCLLDGVPETARRYLRQDQVSRAVSGQEDGPIRIEVFNWASAEMASALAHIFINEVLGYHAVVLPDKRVDSFDAIPVLAGCTDKDCSGRQVRSHVALDFWISDKSAELRRFDAKNPGLGPENVGSMGYVGENSLCVNGAVRNAAYSAEGLALEFYKSYNASFHSAYQFFDRLSDLRADDFLPCNTSGTKFTLHVQLEAYVRWTGDSEGVVNATDGTLMAKCPDGRFWISPACRQDVEKCIPVVAAGDGWLVSAFMQWATFHGMPFAIGISKGFPQYASMSANARTLFHCWLPDATHVQIDPSLLQFPRHKASECAENYYRTSDAQSSIVKFVSRDLRSRAPNVVKFLESFEFELTEMQDLLTQVVLGASITEVACEWVRSKRSVWQRWVPIETQCLQGYGLADPVGEQVSTRAQATGCSLCPAGKASEPYADELGPTHRCIPCRLGTSQSTFGETFCGQCAIGTYANEEGQAYCSRCPLGRYANASGATDCVACSGGNRSTTLKAVMNDGKEKWIEVDGAVSESFCGCVEGWYLSSDGLCTPCMQGALCPGSIEVELRPGYFAVEEEPGNIFRCFGDASRCPGGALGTCAEGRDPRSVTCYDCLPGLQAHRDGTCGPCTGTSYAVILLAAVMIVCLIAVLYLSLNVDADRAAQVAHLSIVALALSQLLTVAQQLAVINKFGIAWEDPIGNILSSFEFMGLNFDVLAISCLARMSPVTKYALRTSAAPLAACVALIVHFVTITINGKARGDGRCDLDMSRLLRTVGSLFKGFFIAIFTAMLAPFQCNEHPNGRFTVQEYDSVFCSGQGEHLHMSVVGGVASLMPISFLALSFWVTWVELPKRLLRADAAYFRACAFLWSRFRPGAELYSVWYLTRNALIALVPLLPSMAAQIVAMNMILYSSVVVVSLVQPWRFLAGNALDVMLHVGLLVVLDMASTFAGAEADSGTSVVMCLFFLLLMGLGVIGAMAYGVILHVARGRRKPWHFFLSHQKSTSGSLARLLKIQLLKRSSRFTTFMDTDNLRDLTELFGFVRDTHTFVFLASPGIERRKWCVGEIVTAKLHDIRTIMLRWPAFQEPDERFRENLTFAIPGIEILASYGMSLQDVSETLTWLHTVETIPMPPTLNLETMGRICDSLTRTVAPRVEEPLMPDCIIVADPNNVEAVATAYVLHEMLMSAVNTAMRCSLPCVLKKGQGIPESTMKALLICSTGCLQSFHLSNWLLDLHDMERVVIPIIAEPGFVVPTEFGEEYCPDEDERSHKYDEVVQAIFKEIATVFAPQSYSSTQEDLELRARQIAFRVQSKSSKQGSTRLGSRVSPSMHAASPSEEVPVNDFKLPSGSLLDTTGTPADSEHELDLADHLMGVPGRISCMYSREITEGGEDLVSM